MPQADDQPAKPLRTWGPILLWTAAIVAATGLAWFIGALAVPYFRTRAAVKRCVGPQFGSIEFALRTGREMILMRGPENTAKNLTRYLHAPVRWTPNRPVAASMLSLCFGEGDQELIRLVKNDEEPAVRIAVISYFGFSDASRNPGVLEVLNTACQDPELEVRSAAAEALKKIGAREAGK